MRQCSGLILVGGKSSRMQGTNKAFLHLGDLSFLEHIAGVLTPLQTVYLSVDDKSKYKHLQYPLIEDCYKEIGPLDGLYSALKNTSDELLFVTACDMPFITWDYVTDLLSRLSADADCLIVSDAKGRLYPLGGLYKRDILPVLEKMITEGCYRMTELIHRVNAQIIPFSKLPFDEHILSNINTPEDYERWIHHPSK